MILSLFPPISRYDAIDSGDMALMLVLGFFLFAYALLILFSRLSESDKKD